MNDNQNANCIPNKNLKKKIERKSNLTYTEYIKRYGEYV